MTAPTPAQLADLHARALAEAQRQVDAVTADDLARSTPCHGWDVRALINHMVSGNYWAAALLTDTPQPDRSADFLGADHRAAFRVSAAEIDAAFHAPGALDRVVQSHFGELPGVLLAGRRFTEMLVHGWDEGRAIGHPADLDEELCEIALRMSRQTLGGAPRREGGPFAAEQEADPDAPAADRLAAFLGRAV